MNKWTIRSVSVFTIALVGLGLATLTSQAQPDSEVKTFDFKDPKGVNGILFHMDSELEPIVGMASGISGTVKYDPAHPAATTGELHIDASTLVCSSSAMTKVLHKADWLGVEEHSRITYTIEKVTEVQPWKTGRVSLKVDGKLTVAGVSVPKAITIEADHVKDGAKARGGAKEGDLLVLRTEFEISRKDFGIKPEMGVEKVGKKIDIIAGIAGYEK